MFSVPLFTAYLIFVSIAIVQVRIVQAIKQYFNSRKQSCVIFDYHEYSTEAT